MLSFSKVLRNVNKPLISALNSVKPSSETKRFWTEDRVDTLKSMAIYTGTLGLTGLYCHTLDTGMQDYLSLSTVTLCVPAAYRGKIDTVNFWVLLYAILCIKLMLYESETFRDYYNKVLKYVQ